jgi:phosphatidylserine/phosphatidylglycerophosphate/cardiolipin synthase-like enzyme
MGVLWLSGRDPLDALRQVIATPTPPPAMTTPIVPLPATPTSIVVTPVAGTGTEAIQAFFTTPGTNDGQVPGSLVGRLIDLINSAQRSIHIAAFEFNLTPLADALVAARQRGVEVQWITDDEHGLEADTEADHGQFALLTNAGIPIKDDARGALMHNKFWIIDGQTVWTGSYNVTSNDTWRNNNNVLLLRSPELAAIYERQFSEMWGGAFNSSAPSTIESQSATIAGTPVQVFFAPEDKVASRLIPLIENARQSIRFMAFSFTHDALGAAVLARAKAGLDVQGIFETRGSETQYSQLPPLFCAGVPVRQDGNPATFHHKVFIIDGQTIVTGSYNFSNNADEGNNENALILTNRDLAAQYFQEFERRWAESKEPTPADMNCQ